MKNKIGFLLLSLILLLGILLRLYHFDSPVADWHSWRQVDTSSVSRNFVEKGFDLLHPTYHDLSNVASGEDNPKGYRFVEFPIFNFLQAGGYVVIGLFTLEQWGRLVSIFASVVIIFMIYLLVRKYYSETAALFAAFFFAVIPFSFYYGRTILPDELMVAASMSGIYFFSKWAENENSNQKSVIRNSSFYFLSLLFIISAFLLKPYALFFTLPMIVIAYRAFGFSFLRKWQLWLYLFLSVLPLIGWRVWMTQFPEGIPSSAWLFNGGNIRFKGAYFFWVFADRIGRLIMGYWGVGLLLFGLVSLLQKKVLSPLRTQPSLFFFSFILSSLLYLVIIARGNVQHDYYQILIVPTLAMISGIGASFLVTLPRKDYPPLVGPVMVLFITTFMVMFGWYHVRGYYNINNQALMTAGKAVDSLTPKDAQVIANYNGDTTFLYQTKRSGWSSYTYDMPKMIELGADYLVLVHPSKEDFSNFEKYQVVEKTDDYALWKLH